MHSDLGQSLQEKISKMVETNLHVSEEILQTTKKIQRYIMWLKVINSIKILIIVVPIIWGIYFLSPYVSQFDSGLGLYGELLGLTDSHDATNANSISADDVYAQIEALKQSGQLHDILDQ